MERDCGRVDLFPQDSIAPNHLQKILPYVYLSQFRKDLSRKSRQSPADLQEVQGMICIHVVRSRKHIGLAKAILEVGTALRRGPKLRRAVEHQQTS
ncbi:hypothetical protein BDV95DRAFT_334102 [Massariosphaeria phaeospora]|uniref:Uncharacterized protein n=1 Tax=Massariosphaeria phaeospora TaxID=100035 RepID=A0A7C8IJP6_9PLEO|nr:hypothetical protein BDV95DRAFT_334102 [Massariosphaeria phaeospora]